MCVTVRNFPLGWSGEGSILNYIFFPHRTRRMYRYLLFAGSSYLIKMLDGGEDGLPFWLMSMKTFELKVSYPVSLCVCV